MSQAQAARLEAIASSLEEEARQLRVLAQELRNASAAEEDDEDATCSEGEIEIMTAPTKLTQAASVQEAPAHADDDSTQLVDGAASEAETEKQSDPEKQSEPADSAAVKAAVPTGRSRKRSAAAASAPAKDDKGIAPSADAVKDSRVAGPSDIAGASSAVDRPAGRKPKAAKAAAGGGATKAIDVHAQWACEMCTLENTGCARMPYDVLTSS
jgi:hypothetical protein